MGQLKKERAKPEKPQQIPIHSARFQTMLSILRKSLAKSTGGSRPTAHHSRSAEDLSAWEIVCPSLSDEENLYSFDGDDVITEGEEETCDVLHLDDVISMKSLSVSPPPVVCFPDEDVIRLRVCDDDNDEYEDDDGEEDDDDVDDELIPWKLKDRFGKQRIRKMGKRGGPKVGKSKRLPHYHNRPGCLYGKHGLGVQHCYI